MIDESTTNSQITDAVTQATTGVVGHGPAASQSLLDTVMSDAVGLGMYNAVSAQQNGQVLAGAAAAATCARILSGVVIPGAGSGSAPPAVMPEPPPGGATRERNARQRTMDNFASAVENSEDLIREARRKMRHLFPEDHPAQHPDADEEN